MTAAINGSDGSVRAIAIMIVMTVIVIVIVMGDSDSDSGSHSDSDRDRDWHPYRGMRLTDRLTVQRCGI